MKLGAKPHATLVAIFAEKAPTNLSWKDAERLLERLGAELSEGRGSRVRVHLNGVRAVFHRPHPKKEASRGAARSLQRFLRAAGVGLES